ncbi:bifunctional folylpolyglutamate synthase/dihydrofolate synthase [Novacetimonas hansenii]|uniref:bifunctional folylpolyglutamate synthase/dihydrofolate synthase n=1 Tax=Novacetimonas hansenii TaxID=436 RepID=UPI000789B6E2|nr:folylpolyglutamate synthase/dihydrofolate synthase family protein [Novacetimonas hansenii]PYD73792.1 bifunctional folylpolyglutamate synthase/dihydrofolate synthase [Novacetimonas hansenii]RFP04679.1 bifunctional folylpolyglutamate synthase/dihydrofolate synthase [Novacetimonas hansenii]WEQ58077.1 bifunctional folylpolyglutamate synthase/dihydrofolate synthase [Novacetimonas hansenii]CUW45990.1 Folylpolyglutamate synthase [Novacetimonas hansenii]
MNASPTSGLGPEFAGRTGVILERLNQLYPALIDLSLGRLEHLLARLGHPERHLPPVIHVAGTNGKGSTCAMIRAIAEAAGWRVHVMTSPHLVHVTERFRIAGRLVSEPELAAVLEEIERVNEGAPITVFEVLTAAGFVLGARHPAELMIVEVGLGGRYDATNVLARPAACAIASISMDHEAFLGDTLEKIALEKAGIIKDFVPVATGRHPADVMGVIARTAAEHDAPLWRRGHEWSITPSPDGARLVYRDGEGMLELPHPGLHGAHQVDNAGLAVATLRASGLSIPAGAWAGLAGAHWPARLQRLGGALAQVLPDGWDLWLDGGHNPGAGDALARVIQDWSDRPVHLIVGMKQTKDASGFLAPLLPHAASVQAVAEPEQHLALPVAEIIAAGQGRVTAGPTIRQALEHLSHNNTPSQPPARVVICGSLYLAGVALQQDGWIAT